MENNKEKLIQSFSELIGIDEEAVRKQVQASGLKSLLRHPGSLFETPEQLDRYQKFMLLRQQLQVEVVEQINSPQMLADYVKTLFIEPHVKESFLVIYTDVKNTPLGYDVVSVGTVNSSMVHPREVFSNAIINRAAGVFVAHNHPSGDPSPSNEDIQITKRLIEAGKIIGIPVVDHVIVSSIDTYNSFSMKAHGMMEGRSPYHSQTSIGEFEYIYSDEFELE